MSVPSPLTLRERALCDSIAERDAAMRADLAACVAIPTGLNYTPGLDEYRAILARRLKNLGAALELIPGQPRPDWLYASASGAGAIPPSAILRRPRPNKPRILIACHLDTVFDPAGDFREMRTAPDGKTAIGPGVVDMKGGTLVAINALEALEAAGIETSWTVILTSDEETGSFHSEKALRAEARTHDIGICTEPALPDGGLVTERLGSGQFMIEAHGKPAHVGRDFESGISAVTTLAWVLTMVDRMSDPERRVIVNVGPLQGGSATNVVPDRARAWGNVRFNDAQGASFLSSSLDSLESMDLPVPGHPTWPFNVSVRRSFNRPAKPLTPGVEKLALAARDAAESLGQSLPFGRTGGVCDGNILQDEGLPTIDTLGVRGGGLHTPQEWIDLSSLVGRSHLFALLLARLTERGLEQ